MKWFQFVASLGIFFLLNLSCNQNKKLEENLGAKVSAEEYKKVVVESWGNTDLSQIKKNDFANVVKSLGINNGALTPILNKGMTIVDVVDQADRTDYHLVIQVNENPNGGDSKLSTRERVLSVKKDLGSQQTFQQAMVTQKDVEDDIQTTPFENFIYVLGLCSIKGVECYRLKVEDFKEPVPADVKNKNCLGFENCEWRGKKVSVVIRVTSTDPSTNQPKTVNDIISYKIVPNAPFLFKMVEYCFEGLSEYNNQKFPIKLCHHVTDLNKGQ